MKPSEYLEQLQDNLNLINDAVFESLENAAEAIALCFRNEGKVYIFGAGSSAAPAYLLNLLFCSSCKPRPSLPSILLSQDLSLLSTSEKAQEIFEKQINIFATEKDLLIGFFNEVIAESVYKGLRAGVDVGAQTIALTGAENNNIHGLTEYVLTAPAKERHSINEIHTIYANILVGLTEKKMFGL